jgi:hypothetical protein
VLLYILMRLQEQCYDNIRISKNAWDTNLIKVSSPARDLVTPALMHYRPTRNTSRSTGRPVEAALLPSFPSMSAAAPPTSFLSSAGTLPLSSTPTGTVTLQTGRRQDGANCSQESFQ